MEIKGKWLDNIHLEVTIPNTSFWLGTDFLVWVAQNKLEFDLKPNQLMKEAAKEKGNMLIIKLRKQEKNAENLNWNKNRKCLECGNPLSNDWVWDICGDCKHRKIKPFKPKYSD